MLRSLLVLTTLLVVSCQTKTPIAQPSPTSPVVTPAPAPIEPPIVTPPEAIALRIALTASTSKVATLRFKDRGAPPAGYVKGFSLVYAKNHCKAYSVAASTTKGPSDKDALSWYNIEPSNRNTFAFLFGLGMRESSGKYCEGRDLSASNVSSSTAEAGMFQASYNSHSAHPILAGLLMEYHEECHLEIFKEGVTCRQSDNTIYGSGPGKAFQQMMRACPAFAIDYSANLIRVLRKHFGPINRKEVEFRPEVVELFKEIEKIVEENPSVCEVL